jgi:hypothetical protein
MIMKMKIGKIIPRSISQPRDSKANSLATTRTIIIMTLFPLASNKKSNSSKTYKFQKYI